jgi:quinol monooxygenase YgiN
MPFVTTVSLRCKPGTRQEIERIYRDIFLPGRRELIAQGDLLSTVLIHVAADQEGEDFLIVSQWTSKEAHDRNEDNPHDVQTQRAATPYLSAPRSYREVRNPQVEAVVRQIVTYGTTAVVLVALFLGCLVALQWLVHPFVGYLSDLALVASTLLVAALFQPVRRRIQSEVDTRLYRERSTTRAAAEEFEGALQNEVDPSQLFETIISRVHETVHPAFVSLWIFPVLHHVEERSLLSPGDQQVQVFGSEIVDPLTAEPTVVT